MKNVELFDVGVNLTSSQFSGQQAEIVAKATASGVERMLIIGCDISDSIDASTLATKFDQYSCAGVHPHNAKSVSTGFAQQLNPLLLKPHVVAVGECGLDYNRDFSPRKQQRTVFDEQIQLALETNMPLYMHERDAHDDFYQAVKVSHGNGVVHCFTGDKLALSRYLSLGFYIGVTGWVCDERRGQELQELVKYLPLDRLLVETDAPYLLPRTIKPKPKSRKNEPGFLPYVINTIAEIKQLSPEQVANATFKNANNLFGIEKFSGT